MPRKRNKKEGEKRVKRTAGKEELRHFKVIVRPIALSPEENQARLRRLCRLIFPHLGRK